MTEAKAFIAPVAAALVGSVVSGIISGAAAIFTFSRSEQQTWAHDQQIVEARLSVLETEVRQDAELRHDVSLLRDAVVRMTVKLEDMAPDRGGELAPHGVSR